jgi:hypothetical protein
MPISKPIRWTLIAVLVVFLAPMALFMAGNLGAGVLDLLLNRKPTATELIGDYKLEVPWGRSFLHIRADGTFQQEIEEMGKQRRSVSGEWQAKDGSNFVDVDFRPFGMVWDDDHERETNIYGINFYKPHLGTTYGLIDDDLGEKYERQQGDRHDR